MNIGILGLGEVGKALEKLTRKKHQVFIKELGYDQTADTPIDIWHICIPYSEKFVTEVSTLITKTKPQLTIINSTVKPGTTQEIHQLTASNLVHAPIDGIHPHLYEYLRTFTKAVGAVNAKSLQLATQHFTELGVKTTAFDSPLETEMAKILSTTYYGWNILFEKWCHSLCEQEGANFNQVYTEFNQMYNQGYEHSLPNVRRPVLSHKPGPIGGHCVIPNAEIIQRWKENPFTEFMLSQNNSLP